MPSWRPPTVVGALGYRPLGTLSTLSSVGAPTVGSQPRYPSSCSHPSVSPHLSSQLG